MTRFIVLIEEPGKDTRALPGSFASEDAASAHASFPEHPGATRFLIAEVVRAIG